jgi:signal transduction histidine kinase/CheY-like chemotaxis protein
VLCVSAPALRDELAHCIGHARADAAADPVESGGDPHGGGPMTAVETERQSQMPRLPVLAFVTAVTAVGAIVLVSAFMQVRAVPLNPYAILLAALTMAGSRFTIKVPGRPATVSVSEVFIFASVLLFGPGPATLSVALDGLLISLTHQNRRVYRLLFNIAEPAIATWCAGSVFFAIAHLDALRGGGSMLLLATIGMSLVFFVLNSGLTALAVAVENGWSAYDVWSRHAVPLAINYYSAAAVASLAVANGHGVDFQVVGLIVPLLVLSYAAYLQASRRVDEAHRHVDEVERLYREARKRDDELRQAQKLEAIGRLAGGVAHDFNNLLTAIRGYSDLLLEDLEPGDRRRDDVDQIVDAANRASGLTKQLLAFSRRQPIARNVFTLDDVVAGTEKILRRLIGEDVELTTVIEPKTGRVYADRGQIEQVLMNLAVNARDAMPKGGRLRIQLAGAAFDEDDPKRPVAAAPGRYVRLSVTDTGCGMSPEIVSHIFEPFFTTKEIGRGTGLGLSTVYGIVDEAGGAIEVDTTVGRGTTFHIYLPETSAVPESGRADATATAPAASSETVLLVEDEAMVAKLVAGALEKAGYTVLRAANAQEALAVVRSCTAPIDLLLTDVVMPGMNGRELADEVVKLRPDIRVLYMSGYTDDALLVRGVKTNSASFIQKPFSMPELTVKIREVLRAKTITSTERSERTPARYLTEGAAAS